MEQVNGSMNKRQRIKKNEDFQKVFKKGKSFANRQFVVYCLKQEEQVEQEAFRIGLSVSKKVGNAVTRVRVKRYIRQAFLELKNEVRQDMDYVIIARTQAATLDFHETKKSLQHVLKVARVYKG
jgi:ribonuclease P protein component